MHGLPRAEQQSFAGAVHELRPTRQAPLDHRHGERLGRVLSRAHSGGRRQVPDRRLQPDLRMVRERLRSRREARRGQAAAAQARRQVRTQGRGRRSPPTAARQ